MPSRVLPPARCSPGRPDTRTSTEKATHGGSVYAFGCSVIRAVSCSWTQGSARRPRRRWTGVPSPVSPWPRWRRSVWNRKRSMWSRSATHTTTTSAGPSTAVVRPRSPRHATCSNAPTMPGCVGAGRTTPSRARSSGCSLRSTVWGRSSCWTGTIGSASRSSSARRRATRRGTRSSGLRAKAHAPCCRPTHGTTRCSSPTRDGGQGRTTTMNARPPRGARSSRSSLPSPRRSSRPRISAKPSATSSRTATDCRRGTPPAENASTDERADLPERDRQLREVRDPFDAEGSKEPLQAIDGFLARREEAVDRLVDGRSTRQLERPFAERPAQREQVVLHRLPTPALPAGPRRQRLQLVLEPVELQPLSQQEEPARDLERRPARGVGDGDDVRCVDQLALERGPPGERRGNPLRDQALGDLLVLFAPRLRTDLIDLRRKLGEGFARRVDRLGQPLPCGLD